MAPRLILVSNRVNVPIAGVPRQAGGLTVAVNAALKQREGVWFGWSGKVSKADETPQTAVTLHAISPRMIFRNITTVSPIAFFGRCCTIASI
jgi:trehalose-6-phosphate synthase